LVIVVLLCANLVRAAAQGTLENHTVVTATSLWLFAAVGYVILLLEVVFPSLPATLLPTLPPSHYDVDYVDVT
jgi:uncharacterized membrane protein YdjX (TVP38/TMEM64 family)